MLVDYDDDSGAITRKAVFNHKDEVWCLAPSPLDAGLVFTAHNTAGTEHHVTLWRMPGVEATDSSDDDDDDDDAGVGGARGAAAAGAGAGAGAAASDVPQELEQVVSLPVHDSTVHSVVWSPNAKVSSSSIMTLDSSTVRLWSLSDGGRTVEPSESGSVGAARQLHAGVWDPHHVNEFTVAVDANVQTWDVRSMDVARSMDGAHSQCVRALSYNPNKPWFLASAGDDGLVKFWDLRRADAPVKVLSGHTHWSGTACVRRVSIVPTLFLTSVVSLRFPVPPVQRRVWSVAFNPFHDQLVLSAGSDSEALLWRVSSISSAPLLDVDDEDEKAAADGLIASVKGHDDSVYSVAWSACNAWTMASLSYSGKLTVCCVPAAEKYQILL